MLLFSYSTERGREQAQGEDPSRVVLCSVDKQISRHHLRCRQQRSKGDNGTHFRRSEWQMIQKEKMNQRNGVPTNRLVSADFCYRTERLSFSHVSNSAKGSQTTAN
ncbi:hypothetical protein GOODEAATRI_012571 [Goodea atripinnis]|uniref:Uncharacterized protein n=1 Tax=Goodea atripinnis TaxID=208336 RepID=A0ABV0PDI5_9TELE